MLTGYDRDRLRAVLAIKRLTFEAFARRLGISSIHLRHVLAGMRQPSERLARNLEVELGHASAFVRGETDELDAREVAHPTTEATSDREP